MSDYPVYSIEHSMLTGWLLVNRDKVVGQGCDECNCPMAVFLKTFDFDNGEDIRVLPDEVGSFIVRDEYRGTVHGKVDKEIAEFIEQLDMEFPIQGDFTNSKNQEITGQQALDIWYALQGRLK